ncbi:MAG TPA: DUF3592 domain-containing protein [Methylotenera sp.]|nr:DUF3592 domain-containing protein [Methylotenera sp.]HPH04304.1 DUF3592 domain-containing protein [Methylotenera sp.]HPM99858.1 DUF3592 domain-containing protein [Methylotenera sp.]
MKTLKIVQYAFGLVGAAMLVGTFFLYQNTQQFLQKSLKAEGIVIDLIEKRSSSSSSTSNSRTYAPKVQFTTANGESMSFTTSSSSYPPSHDIGEKVDVFYMADSPNQAKINSYFDLWGGATILGILGGVFFAIGAGIALFSSLSQRNKSNLTSTGDAIEADFQSVELNTSFSANNSHPYQILTQWLNPRTNELHVFKSENIWFDPTHHIKNKKIKVYIAPNNPKKYYMDISFLPKLAE